MCLYYRLFGVKMDPEQGTSDLGNETEVTFLTRLAKLKYRVERKLNEVFISFVNTFYKHGSDTQKRGLRCAERRKNRMQFLLTTNYHFPPLHLALLCLFDPQTVWQQGPIMVVALVISLGFTKTDWKYQMAAKIQKRWIDYQKKRIEKQTNYY